MAPKERTPTFASAEKAVNYDFKGILMENVRNEMEPSESVFGD